IDGEELRPLFRTIVDRTVIELSPGPAVQLEAAIEVGEIRDAVSGTMEAMSEVEIELKRGDSATAYELGLRLLDVAPLRIQTRSKAERGYRLVVGDAACPAATKARPIELDISQTVDATLHAVGRACLAHLLRNEAAALADEPEGIHQMRVAAR